MSVFNDRWQRCAARAREDARPDESAPHGFATRVLASVRAGSVAGIPMEQLWQRMTWASFAGVFALLVVLAVAEWPHWKNRSPLDAGIEDTVSQLVWSL